MLTTLTISIVLALITCISITILNRDFGKGFMLGMIIFFVSMIVVGIIVSIIGVCSNTSTVEITTVEAEVNHLDITSSRAKNSYTETTYRVSVMGEGFAEVIAVESEIYAQLKVGDKVTVEIETINNTHLRSYTNYTIVPKGETV